MINIEKRIQCGWTLQDFMREFRCSSKEELFKLLRKDFSRKTVNNYLMRMEKNSGIKKKNETISREEMDKMFFCSENETQTKTEEIRRKEGVKKKIVKFFRELIN